MWRSSTKFLGYEFSIVFDDSNLLFSGFFEESGVPKEWHGIDGDADSEFAAQVIRAYVENDLRFLPRPLRYLDRTLLQQSVWEELSNVPKGQVVSYSDLAKSIGRPLAFRAVASACSKNPFSLIVPCHRVVGKSGVGGYRWGVRVKEDLIKYEQSYNGCCKTETLTK